MKQPIIHTSKETLFKIADLMDSLSISWWLDGGWGVDVLYGAQTRFHRDIDIDFDAVAAPELLQRLREMGYRLVKDQMPVREELYHPEHGYLDIHPFVIDGRMVKQVNPAGGYWSFPPIIFGEAVFEGRTIPCISLEGQVVFHSGYEMRESDLHDMELLKKMGSIGASFIDAGGESGAGQQSIEVKKDKLEQ